MNFHSKIFCSVLATILCAASLSAGKLAARTPATPSKPIAIKPYFPDEPIIPNAPPVELSAKTHNDPNELLHDAGAQPMAQSRTPRVRRLWMEVTAYCPCTKCCGPNAIGLTASGKHVSYNNGQFVAADTDRLPFGTKLMIPGYGMLNDSKPSAVEVIDRGGAIKGNKLDVFFPTHEQALEWGRKRIAILVVE